MKRSLWVTDFNLLSVSFRDWLSWSLLKNMLHCMGEDSVVTHKNRAVPCHANTHCPGSLVWNLNNWGPITVSFHKHHSRQVVWGESSIFFLPQGSWEKQLTKSQNNKRKHFFKRMIIMFVYCLSAAMYMWRSEDLSGELVLYYHVGVGVTESCGLNSHCQSWQQGFFFFTYSNHFTGPSHNIFSAKILYGTISFKN